MANDIYIEHAKLGDVGRELKCRGRVSRNSKVYHVYTYKDRVMLVNNVFGVEQWWIRPPANTRPTSSHTAQV